MLPITPSFAALLAGVPERERRGRVFKLLASDGNPLTDTRRYVGPVVSAIGKAAGVVVDERDKAGETVRKFASASRPTAGVRGAMGCQANAEPATRINAAYGHSNHDEVLRRPECRSDRRCDMGELKVTLR